jgi:hypothetical protein
MVDMSLVAQLIPPAILDSFIAEVCRLKCLNIRKEGVFKAFVAGDPPVKLQEPTCAEV